MIWKLRKNCAKDESQKKKKEENYKKIWKYIFELKAI